MFNVTKTDAVQIEIVKMRDGFRIWLNVEGRCAFRAYRIKDLTINEIRFEVLADYIAELRDA